MDIQNFYRGTEFYAQDYLGARPAEKGVVFRTFAPAADGITLLLDGREVPMQRVQDGNFWEAQVPDAQVGDHYEYRIWHAGSYVDHADPYAFASELRPNHRSIVCDLTYQWGDAAWMGARKADANQADRPMNIYEMHLGSWRNRAGEAQTDDPSDWYSYEELAQPLAEYLKETGYNYVEFMPLCEYPFDGSWGYQPTGFFSPTSRYGTPQQLMHLVDTLHQAGIGVILDVVPVHFATDPWGLANYDGTPLFEYPNEAVGVSEWGSHNFMYSRGESCSFMQSSVNFWLGCYHFDAVRMDAISRIIYWQGDESRGINNENVQFIRRLNFGVKSLNPGTFTVAEDSTDFDGTTRAVEQGGLGFDYKWDMGWMHDTLSYFQTDPYFRSGNYHKLSFSMMYFHNERYLLPLSHDEVVHGKATIAQKMWGDHDKKFPQARSLYMYMMVHPGKKLNFMGSEVAQLREWDEKREQDWFMRKFPQHDAFYHYCRDLNHLYLEHPALWQEDYEEHGFEWLDVASTERCSYAIERRSAADGTGSGAAAGSGAGSGDTAAGERIVCVLNLSGATQEDYEVTVPAATKAEVLLDSDWEEYSGTTPKGDEKIELDPATHVLTCTLPPFASVLLRVE
ncbi:MAG: 1,4-alpha-glucan branching protein GlgB [Coriobacteriaceae bacterium]|nr:MAG: 1,4-alpha-glucan branching protein GlgB [Coriobacteriaceae bacterium]